VNSGTRYLATALAAAALLGLPPVAKAQTQSPAPAPTSQKTTGTEAEPASGQGGPTAEGLMVPCWRNGTRTCSGSG
jgi:hypothetical protein